MGSPLNAVVVPVELPEDVTLEDFNNGKVEKIVDSSLAHANLQGVKDVVVIFTRNGKVLNLDEAYPVGNKKEEPLGRNLTPERGDGWTDREWNEILYVWSLAYPRIKRIYGDPYCNIPFGSHVVRIEKDPHMDQDGRFIASPCIGKSTIKLKRWASNYGEKWGPILIHEMAHAFRNWRVVPYDQFEEGHAEFIEVEVSSQIYDETGNFWDYGYLYHGDELINNIPVYPTYAFGVYTLFQQYNTSFVKVGVYLLNHEYQINRDLTSLRYKIAGYSWWKLWFRVPTFFREFNNRIFSMFSPTAPYDTYVGISNLIVGHTRLEDNLYFHEWWQRQYALGGDVIITDHFTCSSAEFGLVGIPSSRIIKVMLYLYWRKRQGFTYEERPFPYSEHVILLIKDQNGKEILNARIPMSGEKGRIIWTDTLPYGTYKIYAYPETCPNLYQERVVYLPGESFSAAVDTSVSFIALVGSEPKDSIYVFPVGDLYPTTHGYYLHKWPIKRARYTVLDHLHPDRWSLFIKDKAPYVVYAGGWTKVPPGQPQNVRVLFKNPIMGIIAIAWKQNKELDMWRYKVVWTFTDTTGRVDTNYIYTTDTVITIGSANRKRCVAYAVSVYAIDRDGNISGKSNTVIDGWWDEDCGPNPLMVSVQNNLSNRTQARGRSEEKIEVYDASGRLIYEGTKPGFKPARKGVFFILKGGKITKEIVK
ncbi:MAG: hypothetical protein GXO39_04195 [Thermotogae bacterium]|nr:hypothetical protein [Thermotogota bacterium]